MNYITYKNTYLRKINHVITEAKIQYNDKYLCTTALWDTGAVHTHITEYVVNTLDISELGEISTLSHGGEIISKKYEINVILPTTAKVENIIVLSTTNIKYREDDIGLVIGMDIIQCGDFHIDYTGKNPVFTFRHPYDGNEDKLIKTQLF